MGLQVARHGSTCRLCHLLVPGQQRLTESLQPAVVAVYAWLQLPSILWAVCKNMHGMLSNRKCGAYAASVLQQPEAPTQLSGISV